MGTSGVSVVRGAARGAARRSPCSLRTKAEDHPRQVRQCPCLDPLRQLTGDRYRSVEDGEGKTVGGVPLCTPTTPTHHLPAVPSPFPALQEQPVAIVAVAMASLGIALLCLLIRCLTVVGRG